MFTTLDMRGDGMSSGEWHFDHQGCDELLNPLSSLVVFTHHMAYLE